MDEEWYVEWRGLLVLVLTHVAWIVASTAHAHRDVWNALSGVTAPLERLKLCLLLRVLTPTFDTGKSRKPSVKSSSLPFYSLCDVTWLVPQGQHCSKIIKPP